jgi:L-lactate utilization protein LutC
MTPSNNVRLDILIARYLDALEREDFDVTATIWQQASLEPDLETALNELNSGLLEEQDRDELAAATDQVAAAAERYLPSAKVIAPIRKAVTVADVVNELLQQTPSQLTTVAQHMTEQLRAKPVPLPEDLGLSKLVAWAEALFGSAPVEYWKAFRQVALKLELRRSAEVEYQLAARQAPKKSGDQK